MENENMKYYEDLRSVPVAAQKEFSNGRFKGTEINPMWRIKRMTEIFGICGVGWYVEIVNRHLEPSIDGKTIAAFVSVNLYVKIGNEWSKPIYGEGGNTFVSWNEKKSRLDTSDEAFKMAYTDAFSNATKQLGLGADIWFENDKAHSTKYDRQQELLGLKNNETPAPQAPKPQPKPQVTPAPQPKPQPETKEPHRIIAAIEGIPDAAKAEVVKSAIQQCKTMEEVRELYRAIDGYSKDLYELVQPTFTAKKNALAPKQPQVINPKTL